MSGEGSRGFPKIEENKIGHIMETAGTATVLLVDGQPIVRHGIAALINKTKNFQVCGEAASAAQALELAGRLKPRMALMDLMLEGTLAMDLIQGLLERNPEIGILIFSMQSDAMFAHRALRAGARGYLLKQEPPPRILKALAQVLEGKTFLSADLLKRMIYFYGEGENGGEREGYCRLSDRELQIFRLLGTGLSLSQISQQLSLERKSVETYCSRMKKKLDLHSLNELVREAIRWSPEL